MVKYLLSMCEAPRLEPQHQRHAFGIQRQFSLIFKCVCIQVHEYTIHVQVHSNGKVTNTAMGSWNTLAVTDLTMLIRGGLWKHLDFGAGKTIECSEFNVSSSVGI